MARTVIRKRPNPAVAESEQLAQNAEGLASNAASVDQGPNFGRATANATKALAQRRRATANKIRSQSPYLIERDSK